jgi:hypothetical protein
LLSSSILADPQYHKWIVLRAKMGILNSMVMNQCLKGKGKERNNLEYKKHLKLF